MAELIGIVGKSGVGKSTSIRTLDPKSTFIINVASKPLPFRGWKKMYTKLSADKSTGNYAATSKVPIIDKLLDIINNKRPEIKTVVLEDSSYLMSFEIFDRATENSYTKQIEIAEHYASVLRKAHVLRDDLMLIVITHPDEEKDTFGEVTELKMKTYAKMTDKYMSLDGLFTYVFFAKSIVDDDTGEETTYRYVFDTNDHSKISTAKTPMDVFNTRYIDNDLKVVVDKINAYNNGDEEPQAEQAELAEENLENE